jgi:hypothetical protein
MDKRLLRLCRFLAAHCNQFVPTTLRELVDRDVAGPPPSGTVRSPLRHTIGRYAQQAVARVW